MQPQINADERGLENLTSQIIGCAYAVSNTLGCGFLEKVYENALVHELRKAGLMADQQQSLRVMYDGVVVGEYLADILVHEIVILEIKAVRVLDDIHTAQCLNYLKATGLNYVCSSILVRRKSLLNVL